MVTPSGRTPSSASSVMVTPLTTALSWNSGCATLVSIVIITVISSVTFFNSYSLFFSFSSETDVSASPETFTPEIVYLLPGITIKEVSSPFAISSFPSIVALFFGLISYVIFTVCFLKFAV